MFLDTNVILDFYLDREEFSDDAEAVLALGYNKACSLFVSALTFANFAYIGRKKYPGNTIYEVLESLREFAEITPVDSEVVSNALSLQSKDFEDAIQFCSAKVAGVNCIVTRNIKDFVSFDIEVLTPKDFFWAVVITPPLWYSSWPYHKEECSHSRLYPL